MTVELSKKDIIHLLRGTEPGYEVMGVVEEMGLGNYIGGFKDCFWWCYLSSKCWDKYSEQELYDLYLKITE